MFVCGKDRSKFGFQLESSLVGLYKWEVNSGVSQRVAANDYFLFDCFINFCLLIQLLIESKSPTRLLQTACFVRPIVQIQHVQFTLI